METEGTVFLVFLLLKKTKKKQKKHSIIDLFSLNNWEKRPVFAEGKRAAAKA